MAGEDLFGIPPAQNQDTFTDRWGGPAYGGYGERIENGHYVPGTSGAERDVQRFREMGTRRTEAPQISRTYSDQSRMYEMGGLAEQGKAAAGYTSDMGALREGAAGTTRDMQLLREGAEGATPSRAEILGNRMADRSLRAQVSAAGNVRGGPGAQAAAYRYAAQNAASQRADMAQGIQAERAAELANARQAYAGASGAARRDYAGAAGAARGSFSTAAQGVRGQDIGMATTQAQLEAQQRAEDMQNERFYEQLGSNTRFGDLAAQQTNYRGEENQRNVERQMRNSENAADWQKTKDVVSMGTGAASGGIDAYTKLRSDVRAKEPVGWGSLAPLDWGASTKPGDTSRGNDTPKGEDTPAWLDAEMGRPRDTTGTYAGGIYRNFPEDDEQGFYRGGIEKADPYMTSDENAKRDAYLLGRAHGVERATSGQAVPFAYGPPKAGEKVEESFAPQKRSPTGFTRGEPVEEEKANRERDAAKAASGAVLDSPLIMASPMGAIAAGMTMGGAGVNAAASKLRKTTRAPDKTEPLPPAREDGGPVKGGEPYLVGEAGPEIVVPKKDGEVVPNKEIPFTMSDQITAEQMKGLRSPKKFKVDSAEDRKRDLGAYYDQIARQADEQMAAWQQDKGRASVALNEGDVDDAKGAQLASGDKAMEGAMRSMEPSAYAYKPEFTPPEQARGEVNVGPMANKMAKDPVAGTAIARDPQTGMLQIDKDKGLKLVMGSLASLQHQLDAIEDERNKRGIRGRPDT